MDYLPTSGQNGHIQGEMHPLDYAYILYITLHTALT